ncbi:MAG: helix-turn-helix transcriptional regulator [Clostridia bacterium]|nr:helix-turn-helix transcriptional regulator [Clostridia bacterium]
MNEEILEKYKINFGLYVKEHRERKGYTQQQLSELIGITPKSISYIERGENYPSPDNLFELAKVLDMSLDEFVFSHKKFD